MCLHPFPPPPPDFNERTLPCFVTQGHWLRLNKAHHDTSLCFNRSGKGRFDGPHQGYGILYVGEDEYSPFIECFGRKYEKYVSVKAVRNRNLFKITSDRPLVLADATGPGLAQMGTDSRISSGDYEDCRTWGQAIWEHPQCVDGIRYRSRHDDSVYSIGLFDRVKSHLQEENLGNLYDNHPSLKKEIEDRYGYVFLED